MIERVCDLVADATGLDPAEVRRRNFIQPDDFPVRHRHRHAALRQRQLRAGARPGARAWSATRICARSRRNGAQAGPASCSASASRSYVEVCGVAPSKWIGLPGEGWGAGLWESANVKVHLTGKVVVTTGSLPHGQGHETTFAQLVADRARRAVRRYRGRAFRHARHAVRLSAPTAAARSRSAARRSTRASTRSRRKREARRAHAGSGRRKTSSTRTAKPSSRARPTAARRSRRSRWRRSVALRPAGRDGAVPGRDDLSTIRRTAPSLSARTSAWSRSIATPARSTLLRYVAVDDVGNVINPLIVDGQLHGGIAQGMAQALYEGARYDDDGQLSPAR